MKKLGVVVVTYNASDVIAGCLESLMNSVGVRLRIVVVDNASRDDTVDTIRRWSADRPNDITDLAAPSSTWPDDTIALVSHSENTGFAGGVNAGLKVLLEQDSLDDFWIVNPDSFVPPATAARFATLAAEGPYSFIGGRVFYQDPKGMIQSDGGEVDLWSGTCRPHNLGAQGDNHPAPDPSRVQYASGANMMVSRSHIDSVGLMNEDYFLYYEEVDWCLRPSAYPVRLDVDANIIHLAGHSIGSATLQSAPSATASYFMARARLKFVARHRPIALPYAFAYVIGKALRAGLRGHRASMMAMLRGSLGLPPPSEVKAKIGREYLPRKQDNTARV